MKLSDLVPSADLLEKIEGLEAGLRQRRRLGRLGKLGTAIAFLTWATSVLNVLPKALSGWILDQAPWALAVAVLVLLLGFLAILYSVWLQESRHPIRYTCSLGDFSAVSSEDNKPATPVEEKMTWLRHDLARHLNQRVGRLMFLFSRDAAPPAPSKDKEAGNGQERATDQHIRIEGVYRLQNRASRNAAGAAAAPDWEIVVMPRVRIGVASSPEKLAKPVFYPLRGDQQLSVAQYEELVEQIYFNIVTEVYQQIRQDVERKIALLPTRRHKAVAYYYEAEDYARSNTLRAYEEAGALYREASRYFEPYNPLVNPFPASAFLWWWRWADALVDALAVALYRALSYVRPSMAQHDLLAARAKLGYANMLLFRCQLSELLGRRRVPMFEARRFAREALDSLKSLPEDVPGRSSCLFDAHVTSALSWSILSDWARSREHLEAAEAREPSRATTSAVYLLTKSLTPSRPDVKHETLTCAVEQDPGFEIARFSKAYEREMRWRAGPNPTSARHEAEMVINEYKDVLRLNPSNIAAAANAAFVHWALGKETDFEEAKDLLSRALRYNELAPETLVVEHHYSLARVHAELGEFGDAFKHLVVAEEGRRAHRSTHNVDPSSYFFRLVADDLRRRYESYRDKVLQHASREGSGEHNSSRNAVCAFVLDEFGQACWSHYWVYSRDENIKQRAIDAFNESIARDGTYVMSHYHLAQVVSTAPQRSKLLDRVMVLDPSWQEALLELAFHEARGCERKWSVANDLEKKAAELQGLREESARLIRSWTQGTERQRENVGVSAEDSRTAAPVFEGQQSKNEIAEVQNAIKAVEKEIKGLLARVRPAESVPSAASSTDLVDEATKAAPVLRAEVRKRKKDVQGKARALLPHDWLWLSAGTESNFNEGSLGARFMAEGKWEREFSYLQVSALHDWTKPLLWNDDTAGLGRTLLHHIKEVFLPAELQLLFDCQLVASEADLPDLKLQAGRLVNGWLLVDPWNRSALSWIGDERFTLTPDDLTERLAAARESAVVPRRLLRPLALNPMKEGDEQFMDPHEHVKAAESYRKVLDLNAGGPEIGLAAGKLATLLLVEGKLSEAEPLVERSLPTTYSLLPSAAKNPAGDVERLLMKHELARIELKLCYERQLRKATDRGATDAVMGLLSVRGCEECRPTEYNNVRTPLAVEWDEALLPAGVDDFLLKEAAPRFRQRLEERYGVRVPGVRFRAITEAAKPGLYRILDHEVVVEEGEVSTSSVPISGAATTDWQSPLHTTMERLEAYVERHLTQWIRVQDVQSMLEHNCQDRYHPSIPDSISEFETHKHIGPLTVVIRSLVAERVPIREFSKVYDLYRRLWEAGEHVQAMTREIRKDRAVRPVLWGNGPDYERFVLSETAEAELWAACESIGDFTALVLQPDRREEVVSVIVGATKAARLASLTVRRAALRPLLRRLIEPNLPEVPVLAEEEIECHVRAIEAIEISIPPGRETPKVAT